MAKFTNKDLRLKDGQKVTWGTDLDANIWWDGTADDLRLDHTISGVDPTQDYHLTTKFYVDTEVGNVSGDLATLSGALSTVAFSGDHGDLSGRDDDDHTQYILVDGSRGFTSTVSGVDPTQDFHLATKNYIDTELATLSGGIVQDHGGLVGLDDDDHTQYTLADGTRSFSGVVGGVTPTANNHLTTKQYVDNTASTLSGSLADVAFSGDHGDLSGRSDDDHTQYILVDGTRAFTGVVGGVTPTSASHLTTKDYVDAAIQGLDWQESVLDFWSPSAGLPVSPNTGDRYVADDSGNGWTEDNVYTWDGSQWNEVAANDGMSAWFEDEDVLFVYSENPTTSGWVRFGSTVTHNNTNGLQGGTANEYFHLRQAEYYALAYNGNNSVDDATGQHHHDSRYYTESEIDTTLSGYSLDGHTHTSANVTDFDEAAQDAVGNIMSGAGFVTVSYDDGTPSIVISGSVGAIDHGGLAGLGDDDHTQYILADGSRSFTSTASYSSHPTFTSDTQIVDKKYVDDEIATLSGSIVLDHGGLTGLADDDHTQYILVDGSRGFTNTVSGVTPIQDYELATKGYVDSADSPQLHGRQAIADGASTVTVSFTDVGTTSYTVHATLENTSDAPPSIYPFIISAKTSSSFTCTFAGDMDSANYLLDWVVFED